MSASLPPPKQAAKKQKKTTSSAAQPAIPDPEPNLVPDVVDGDAEATDGGIDAAHARVRGAGRSRLLTAREKRDRFQAKYDGKTPEQILDTISKGWRSRIYEHFKALFIVRGPKGAVMHRFVCKKSPSKHVDHADYEDSTGNLKHHVKLCEPEDTPEQQVISAFATGSAYSPARLWFLLAIWCATRHRPFAIVEDPEFKGILGMFYRKVHIPSRVTISRDIHNIVDKCTTRVIELFEVHPSAYRDDRL
ncbi:hypothetical protein LXA43DRAFT_900837 [Ganoderma leucocontextum]|nr:hypothetical protein LXA43DRAFT_900837 [Ganoderma leucocontextum]